MKKWRLRDELTSFIHIIYGVPILYQYKDWVGKYRIIKIPYLLLG